MVKKNTYLSEIIIALEELGGCGSLKEINRIIKNRNLLSSIHSNPNWERNVSAVIQRHCSETKSYKGATNYFYSVYGLGEGFWGLRNFANEDIAKTIIENRICNTINNNNLLKNTEKEMLIKARVGQGVFRDKLLDKYKRCIITGLSDSRLLIASHIRPWHSANNYERLSTENGLLLSPLYDKLFDIGLISFSNDMRIIISKELSNQDISKIGIESNKPYLYSPSQELQLNMQYHRTKIFKG